MRNYQIDLHYHAGSERIGEKTLADYIAFAKQTGRRILGITDHLDAFLPEQSGAAGQYPRTAQGIVMLRREIEEQKENFPEMQLFLGPEISFRLHEMRDAVVEASDYFICEPVPFRGDGAENTELFEKALEKAAHLRQQTGKPTFLAHPFRSQMYHRYDSGDFGPENGKNPAHISEEEAGAFLGTDLAGFAKAAKRFAVPVEINGMTLSNAKSLNWPYFADVLYGAYAALAKHGVSFVPGSDQHSISVGHGAAPVPGKLLDWLGIQAKDLPFVSAIGAKTA